MKRLLAVLLIVLFLLAAASRVGLAARPPLVLAFYYAWFDENTWKPNQLPDLPAVSYTSRNPQAVARQIKQAQGAGIDAFVVSWWGQGNPTEDNLKLVLDQARAAGMSIAVDFEVTSPFYNSRDQMVNSLKYLMSAHARHPAYLRVDGKPVIFFWREQKYSVDAWKSIRDAVDPNRQYLWIAEGVDASYLRVFDGHHLYSVGWAGDVGAELRKWADRTRSAGGDKIWVATVMPGNDDTRTGRKGSYVRGRSGGEYYRAAWRGAFSSSPDWIIVTSWNEWFEGTMIEPSVTYGDLYLNITREFAAQFKKGLPPPTPKPTRAPTAKPTPAPTAAPPATLDIMGSPGRTTDVLRVRAAPNAEGKVLGRLSEGAEVTLLARSLDGEWWQIAYPDSVRRGWVSAEFIAPTREAFDLPVVMELAERPTPGPTTVARADVEDLTPGDGR